MEWALAAVGGGAEPQAALVRHGRVRALGLSLAAVYARWQAFAAEAAAMPVDGPAVNEVRLLAPAMGAIFGAGANYGSHVREMTGGALPPKAASQPFFFQKVSPHCLAGHRETVSLPYDGVQLDWEAEIAVVIGRMAWRVVPEHALAHVAGYAAANDLSLRDRMKRADTVFAYDWIGQKSFPGACPLGPWLTPAAAVPDPQRLGLRLWVDGDLMQDGHSSDMHWTVAEQLSWLSHRVALRPGDIILTGTPAGVGHKRGRYLRPGETVRIAIDGLGELVTPIGAPA